MRTGVILVTFLAALMMPLTGASPPPTSYQSVGAQTSDSGSPAPEPLDHCVEVKETNGPRLKPCWEHPITVTVILHIWDGVRWTEKVDFTEGGTKDGAEVVFLSDQDPCPGVGCGPLWENLTGNGTNQWKRITHTNQSGGTQTGKFYRIPDPLNGYASLINFTFNITVYLQATIEIPYSDNETREYVDARDVTIPNDDTEIDCRPRLDGSNDCRTNYDVVFDFYFRYDKTAHAYQESIDGNYLPTFAVGLIGFNVPIAILASRHFMMKREKEEEKRREKETRFKV